MHAMHLQLAQLIVTPQLSNSVIILTNNEEYKLINAYCNHEGKENMWNDILKVHTAFYLFLLQLIAQ
jgi:hypothetical protein